MKPSCYIIQQGDISMYNIAFKCYVKGISF